MVLLRLRLLRLFVTSAPLGAIFTALTIIMLALGEGFEPPHHLINSQAAYQLAYPRMRLIPDQSEIVLLDVGPFIAVVKCDLGTRRNIAKRKKLVTVKDRIGFTRVVQKT